MVWNPTGQFFFYEILYHFLTNVHRIVLAYVFMCHLSGDNVQHFAVVVLVGNQGINCYNDRDICILLISFRSACFSLMIVPGKS